MVKVVLRDDSVPEVEKARTRGVLRRVLLDSLALLHPFMPFVSCEIREALHGDGGQLPLSPFPAANPEWADPLAVEAVETIRAAATRIRNLRAERGLPQTQTLATGLEVEDGPLSEALSRHAPLLGHLARLESVTVAPKVDLPGAFHDSIGPVGLVVLLPVQELGPAELAKLEKELAVVEKEAWALRRKLADEKFVARAPEAVVQKNRAQLEELESRRRKLAGNLGRVEVDRA